MPPSDPAGAPHPDRGHGGPTRANPAWLLIVAGILLAARVGIGIWDATNPESRPEAMAWTAPTAAAEVARDRGRLVLYAFTDRHLPASRRLASQLFTDAGVARELSGQFVAVRLEGPAADDTPETAALRGRFEVRELPALVVATPDHAKFRRIAAPRTARSAMEALTAARFELLDLPLPPRNGVRFQIGGRRAGAVDSSAAGDPAAPDGD